MKTTIFIILSLLFSLGQLSAQDEYAIQGVAMDSLGESIIGASVILSSKVDSVMAGFSLTDAKGRFTMKKIPTGEYFLQITYMGYRNHIEYAKIPREDKGAIYDFGTIVLQEGNTLLEEVVVMEDRIPILIKKDTIEYNAGSFEVHENAVVEELLEELPGVEVDEEGNIKANGKEVDKVLVDGKEFFGKDPKMATRNLPAKAVDKVQVYDEKSEEAQFSGMVGGADDEETTINLKLKEEYKKGYLGKSSIGAGTDNTFAGKLNLNKFDKKNQLAIVARANNTSNTSGLSVNESINMAGGLESMLSDDGMVNIESNRREWGGITNSGLIGLNYNWKKNPKFTISSNYTLSATKNQTDQITFQENVLENLRYSSIDTLYTEQRELRNRVNLNFRINPDSTFRASWKSNVSYNVGDNNSISARKNINDIGITNNAQQSSSLSDNNNYTFNSKINLQKRLKNGIILGSNSELNLSNRNSDYNSLSNTSIFDDENNILDIINLDRISQTDNPEREFYQELTYIQPLGKFFKWENKYGYRTNTNIDNNQLEELENGARIVNEDLSRDFELGYQYHGVLTNLQYKRENYSIAVGMNYRNARQDFAEGNTSFFNKQYHFFLPSFNGNIRVGKRSRFGFRYRTSNRMPRIDQLNPVVNDNNPSRIRLGNLDLNPEYVHTASFNYFFYDQFTFNSLSVFSSMNRTENTIINQSVIDDNLVETIRPENAGVSTNYMINLNYGTPLNFMKSRISFGASTMLNYRPNSINGLTEDYRQTVQNLGVDITNKKKKHIDVKLSYDLNYSQSKNLDAGETLPSFVDHSFTLKTNYRFTNGLRLGNKVRYSNFPGSNQSLVIWNAFVEKTLFKNKKGIIQLSVNDILNNNRGITQEANNFYTLRQQSNSRGLYAMLTFSYNFTIFSGAK